MKQTHGFKAAGLGLVELLIALAITATLLTSVAIAFHASLETIEENQKIATATQSARVVLHRMMAESRCADAIDSQTSHLSILPPDDGSGVLLTEYELVDSTLWYRRKVGTVTTSYEILTPGDGVIINDFWVARETALDDGGMEYTKNITARLALQVGDNKFAVTASTNPRRNVQW